MNKLIFLCLILISVTALAQREIQSINSCWEFYKGDIPSISKLDEIRYWENVNIPHDWNALDILDDIPGYYRGTGIYRKIIPFYSSDKGKKIYLYFEGANQDAEVYLNGSKAGGHHGGYTSFCIDITPYIQFDNLNPLVVKLSNAMESQLASLIRRYQPFRRDIQRSVSCKNRPCAF